MKLRMIFSYQATDPKGHKTIHKAGTEPDIPDGLAKKLIKDGYAEPSRTDKDEK